MWGRLPRPRRFAGPLHGPSRWLFLAAGDGQIPLWEEKQSCGSCWPQAEGLGGSRAGRADVCLALTLTRACGAASCGGAGTHRSGAAGGLGHPRSHCSPHGTPGHKQPCSLTAGTAGAAPQRGGGRRCPPSAEPGGAAQLHPATALPPPPALTPSPRSEPPSDRGSCRDEVTPARRPSPCGAQAPPVLTRAAMWHRPRKGLPSNKGVHPWPEPNPPPRAATKPASPEHSWPREGPQGLAGLAAEGQGQAPGSDVSQEASNSSGLGALRAQPEEEEGPGGGGLSTCAPLPAGSPLGGGTEEAEGGCLPGGAMHRSSLCERCCPQAWASLAGTAQSCRPAGCGAGAASPSAAACLPPGCRAAA